MNPAMNCELCVDGFDTPSVARFAVSRRQDDDVSNDRDDNSFSVPGDAVSDRPGEGSPYAYTVRPRPCRSERRSDEVREGVFPRLEAVNGNLRKRSVRSYRVVRRIGVSRPPASTHPSDVPAPAALGLNRQTEVEASRCGSGKHALQCINLGAVG